MKNRITIGITQPEARFEKYRDWILDDDPSIELVTLSAAENNIDAVAKCDGVVLSGGVDVDPSFYNSERRDYPNKPSSGWDEQRDRFEIEVFRNATAAGLPVLAICRGMQLVNASLAGTIVADLEEAGRGDHRRKGDTDKVHTVTIEPGTLLAQITGVVAGNVNSAHHQSVEKISGQLRINCLSEDGVIEGAEWKDALLHRSPLLCVQWHPERILDKEQNPLSENIRSWFISEVKK